LTEDYLTQFQAKKKKSEHFLFFFFPSLLFIFAYFLFIHFALIYFSCFCCIAIHRCHTNQKQFGLEKNIAIG